MINELFKIQIPITNDYSINVARMALAILLVVLLYFIYRLARKVGSKLIRTEEGDIYEKKLRVILKYFWIFSSIFVVVYGLKLHEFSILNWMVTEFDLDWDITKEGFRVFKVGSIILGMIIIQMARFLDLLLTRLLENNLKTRKINRIGSRREISEEEVKRKTNLTIQYTVYGVAIMLLLNIFNLDATIIPNSGTPDKPGFSLNVSDVLQIIVIILLARLGISLLINVFLRGVYRSKGIDQGRQYSFNQLLSYFIYVFAVLFAIKSLGYSMTIIFGGFAALLVGIGLGLQQTFNDFFSGIILLFERSVEVGNILEIEDEEYGEVEKIGLRTSVLRNRDNIMKIIPNSVIVNGIITNLSHIDNKSRFFVELGVAYDTDLKLLERIMFDVVSRHEDVLPYPQPQVLFNSISASTFNVRLYFWTTRVMSNRSLKSEIRWELINMTRVHGIEVAYEQYDVRFRNNISAELNEDKGIRITPISPDRDFSHLKEDEENDEDGEDEEKPEKDDQMDGRL